MTRKEFYVKYAQVNGISQAKAKQLCKSVFDLLARCIYEEDRVYIKGFGTFKKKLRAARIVNGIQKTPLVVPEKEEVVFVPSPHMGETPLEDEDEEDEDYYI